MAHQGKGGGVMSNELIIGLKLFGVIAVILGVAVVLICSAKANGEDCQCDRCRAKADDETHA